MSPCHIEKNDSPQEKKKGMFFLHFFVASSYHFWNHRPVIQPSNSSGEVARTALGLAFERSLRIEATCFFLGKNS